MCVLWLRDECVQFNLPIRVGERMTNFERIKAMSVEEMAALINDVEEQLMLPPCSKEHCAVYAEDGVCKNCSKEPCTAANVSRKGWERCIRSRR